MMHDGKALQSGTSHYFGDGFARAFGIQYTDRNNQLQFPHQTSWGMSTRIIGAIIMTHGDDNGLVLPPAVAPIQLVILPIAQHKPGVLDKARELADRLKAVARVKVDDSDNSAGWKFAEYEMKGVPLRLEIGPRDIENNQCVLVRRDNREKTVVSLDELETAIPELLKAVHDGLYRKALARRESMTFVAHDMDEMKEIADNKPGLIKAMWCGDLECEMKLKEDVGVTSRCMPFEQETVSDTCICCGKPAKTMVVWGKAY
jgi:prolyl-tRNA synthetase